jgi:hypothetical protein
VNAFEPGNFTRICPPVAAFKNNNASIIATTDSEKGYFKLLSKFPSEEMTGKMMM